MSVPLPRLANCSDFTPEQIELLSTAAMIAERELEPTANAADRAICPPSGNIALLANAGLLGLTAPKRYGGHEAPPEVLYAYTEILSAACGLTTFVQGQHLSACLLASKSENKELQKDVLPSWARAERLCGIAFSHVRRPGSPTLRVAIEKDEVVFDGEAPWFTGWGLMDDVAIAGTLDDGRYLFAVGPVRSHPGIAASEPMSLCAMNASGTVTLSCHDYRIPRSRILKIVSHAEMARTDDEAILAVTAQPIGVMRAAARLVARLAEERGDGLLAAVAERLVCEREELRTRIDAVRRNGDARGNRNAALRLRAEAIELGVRLAHTALAASGGGGNALDHSAQRLFREAMFYTLTAQTPAVREATVRRLSRFEAPARTGNVEG